MDNKQTEWNNSYQNLDNFVFYPHEEVIRFVSKFIRKKIGLNEYKDVIPHIEDVKILDVGCGIGRHVIYCHQMGLQSYGIDLSEIAIKIAINWSIQQGMVGSTEKIQQGDIRLLPWNDQYFDYAISHGVLDSMPLEVARLACIELARTMRQGGLFYCDLISGNDSEHSCGYCGEEIVLKHHEVGTIQSYFNIPKIHTMINGLFDIIECTLIRREDVFKNTYTSRYHLILKRM